MASPTKTLVLVRHAKSSWDDPSLADHDRPLNARGRADAPVMARRLNERGITPELIVTSTAVRARSTALAFAAECDIPADRVVALDELYGSSPSEILRIVGGLDDAVSCAIVVAHDPGMSELASRLDDSIDEMPTCAVAEFGFELTTWREVANARPTTSGFDAPGLS